MIEQIHIRLVLKILTQRNFCKKEHITLSTPLSSEYATVVSNFLHLHQYFPCFKILAGTHINTRNGYKVYDLVSNPSQDFSQDVKNVNCQGNQIIRIQIIGLHFTCSLQKVLEWIKYKTFNLSRFASSFRHKFG